MDVDSPPAHIGIVDINDIRSYDFEPALLQNPALVCDVPQINVFDFGARLDLVYFVSALRFMQDIDGAIAPVFGKRRLADILFPLDQILLRTFEHGRNIELPVGGVCGGFDEIAQQAHRQIADLVPLLKAAQKRLVLHGKFGMVCIQPKHLRALAKARVFAFRQVHLFSSVIFRFIVP